MNSKFFQIAMDGPVASGKGTVCRLLSQRLGFLYVDTGAMYRVAALLARKNGFKFDEYEKVVPILKKAKIELKVPGKNEKDGRLITVMLDGKDVSWDIRTEEMGYGASVISQFKPIREILVKKQQEIANSTDVVMEGRDITHNVLPKAQLKIYLTANEMIRAERRHAQLLEKGQDVSFAEVYNILHDRDTREMNRKLNPLKVVNDAWVLDTSELEIDKVVELIVDRVNSLKG